MDNFQTLSTISRQETTTTINEPADEQLPSEDARRADYLTFTGSCNIKSDTPYDKINIDTQHLSLYEEI